MNFRIRKKKVTWKQRVLSILPFLVTVLYFYLTSDGKLPWKPLLFLTIAYISLSQTMLSIGFGHDRPTFKRFIKRLPIYFSHLYLPLLLCTVFSNKAEGITIYLFFAFLLTLGFETCFYLIVHIFSLMMKHRAMLEKIAVPVVLIVFFALYGLATVGNPHLATFISFIFPLSTYCALCTYVCIWKHGYCFKTLPWCLLKILVIMVLPWWVLSSQTEMSDNFRLFVALQYLAFGLIQHFIVPRLLIKGDQERKQQQ